MTDYEGSPTAGCTRKNLDLLVGLEAYWRFDLVANLGYESTAAALQLSVLGGLSTGSSSVFGRALAFDGNDARYAARPFDDSALDIASGSDLSVQLWARFNGPGNGSANTLLDKLTGSMGPGWYIERGVNDTLTAYVSEAGLASYQFLGNTVVTDARWHHIVLIRQGPLYRFCVDGVCSDSTTPASSSVTDSTEPLVIGHSTHSSNPMNGAIDEVAIWSRALSTNEIVRLYNTGSGLALPTP